jgi:RNA polymerase sigma-70 factor (ECF subfamily)
VSEGRIRTLREEAQPAVPATNELEDFVAEHYPRLLRLAGLICRSVPDAEDAVQAGLERAWRSRTSLRDVERLRPWLDRIVVREAIRAGSRRLRAVADLPVHALSPARADEWVALRIAFDELSSEQRAALVLHLYAGYSVTGIAEVLGIPVETVRSRLRLGRQRLRSLLAEGD